jgi:hypothetical protein
MHGRGPGVSPVTAATELWIWYVHTRPPAHPAFPLILTSHIYRVQEVWTWFCTRDDKKGQAATGDRSVGSEPSGLRRSSGPFDVGASAEAGTWVPHLPSMVGA